MKIKDGYVLREVVGNYIVVAIGDEAVDFNGLITINETGAFIWEQLQKGKTEDEILLNLLTEYDIEKDAAKNDLNDFLKKLEAANLLEK